MNDSIKKVVDKLHDRDEFLVKLSTATDRSITTINRHWLGKEYKIPSKFYREALRIATNLYKKQERYIRNLEVQFEEVKP